MGLIAPKKGNRVKVMAKHSRYVDFTAKDWAKLRADTPLELTEDEVIRLRSMGDHIDLKEVERIYLSLSRLLSRHVVATQNLFQERREFLNFTGEKTPFIIGIAGSVAVGKSTTARVLQELLRRWPSSPKVDLITTDGFLLPNKTLQKRNLMRRKGFPQSYDRKTMIRFLSDIKAGERRVQAPLYSHLIYDVLKEDKVTIDQPDILIFEGLNVLQTPPLKADKEPTPLVSDYFDFSIYVDANTKQIERWYMDRFMRLRDTAFTDPSSFFHKYSKLTEEEARTTAQDLWDAINLKNLTENILPTRKRANLILRKGTDHLVEKVSLRRL